METSILVVDDDPAIRLLVSRVLARAGYPITEAIDGDDAIKKLTAQRFDVIVLDLMMPNVNGYQVIAFVRQQRPGNRCVVVTSAAAERDIGAADDAVVAVKLRKPFDLSALLAAVRHCANEA